LRPDETSLRPEIPKEPQNLRRPGDEYLAPTKLQPFGSHKTSQQAFEDYSLRYRAKAADITNQIAAELSAQYYEGEKDDEDKKAEDEVTQERLKRHRSYQELAAKCEEVEAMMESGSLITKDPLWAQYVFKLAESHQELMKQEDLIKRWRKGVSESQKEDWIHKAKQEKPCIYPYMESLYEEVKGLDGTKKLVLKKLTKEVLADEQHKEKENNGLAGQEEQDGQEEYDEEGKQEAEITTDKEVLEAKQQGAVRVSVDEVEVEVEEETC
jgi:hypothetical protein